ncbi:hypothetical protein [Dyadobacter sp. CY343]|uniref:hypothetical protein n=1 Tax=Dyadobacter sp. CY343 TaxID=2907299 RepID=UPI001F1FAC9E|nr:hypothetical protein [Dyadobacter sp. CY343]MCE7061264.1 hypothetical protein [Dyadobacter sp. CY343]
MSKQTYSLADKAEGHSFVNGNTKFLKDMNQDDLAILAGNGDPRVKVDEKSAEDKKLVRAASSPTV